MEEQLISFETAKLAKEKGFNINCDWKIDNESKLHFLADLMYPNNSEFTFNPYDDPEVHEFNKFIVSLYEAPTQSLLQKWLREVHNIHVSSSPTFINKMWYPKAVNLDNTNDDLLAGRVFNIHRKTFEESLELGLQEALKLIKTK